MSNEIVGTVVKGALMGKKIGFPTINVAFSQTDLKFGVYACKVEVKGTQHKGALHYGPRKVLGLMEPSLEVHILDFGDEIYGEKVKIWVYDKIRDTKNFEDMDSLKRQIRRDVDFVKQLNF